MSFVNAPAAKVVYRFVDETGSQAAATFHIPFATLAATALTNAGALAALILPITGCMLTSYTLGYEVVENDPSGAGAGSNVEKKGRFIWSLANGLESRTEIPALLQADVLGDGAIDLANSDIEAFFTAVLAGTAFCGSDGSDITALKAAYVAFRRSTRHMLPTRRRSI